MQTSNLIPGIFALLLLFPTGCGDGEAPDPVGAHDLGLRWETGMKYRVREERTERSGAGSFPPAAEIEARTDAVRRELSIFEDEVIETDGGRLYRIRRTYITSVRGPDDAREPTPLSGKTYEIRNPLPIGGRGGMDVRTKDPGGTSRPVSEEEVREIAKGALRLATTLLPRRPVRKGETWPAGRNLRTLQFDPTTHLVRLEAIETGRTARLAWRPRGWLRAPGDTAVSIDEIVTLDLVGRRIGSYRSDAEYHQAAPVRKWRQVSIEVSVTPVERTPVPAETSPRTK